MNEGTREHYREFSKSPLDAYKQLLKEQYGDAHVNSYMDRLHSARMKAVYKHRTEGGKYLEHLANELKNADVDVAGLGRELQGQASSQGKHFRKAFDLEKALHQADPKAYQEWRRIARESNIGGTLDQQAEDSLKNLGKQLYGKANKAHDIAHDSSVFGRNLKEGLRSIGIPGEKIKEILSSGDYSKLSREEQSNLLKQLLKHGPKLQTDQIAEDISKSFSGGRAGYRGLAGGALKADELAGKLRDKGKLLRQYGKYGLAAGGGLAGLGLLGRYLNRGPNITNYQVSLPGYTLAKNDSDAPPNV